MLLKLAYLRDAVFNISFRMESRVAAEAVILRLNGKKVRGWDDAENRVYLRIADTLDQRELRVRSHLVNYFLFPVSELYSSSGVKLPIARRSLPACQSLKRPFSAIAARTSSPTLVVAEFPSRRRSPTNPIHSPRMFMNY